MYNNSQNTVQFFSFNLNVGKIFYWSQENVHDVVLEL